MGRPTTSKTGCGYNDMHQGYEQCAMTQTDMDTDRGEYSQAFGRTAKTDKSMLDGPLPRTCRRSQYAIRVPLRPAVVSYPVSITAAKVEITHIRWTGRRTSGTI
jgi:hypothetical protein